jgi:hypothetical protein
VYHAVNVTRSQLDDFLGPQQSHLIDQHIGLVEVFAGKHARTSIEMEKTGKKAIRIGLAWGHDLTTVKARTMVVELIKFVQPDDALVAWPCTSVRGFSQLNYHKHPELRHHIDTERVQVGNWINMFGDIFEIQHAMNRGCHAENPTTSLAWKHPRLAKLCGLLWVKFDQCQFGLRSIRPPHHFHRKDTTVLSNRTSMQHHLNRRCSKDHEHEVIQGAYQGQNLSKAAENYPTALAKALVKGMTDHAKWSEHSAYAGFEKVVTSQKPKHSQQYLRQLHVALGHASPNAMAQVLKEAGANNWLQEEAKKFSCSLCDAQKGP